MATARIVRFVSAALFALAFATPAQAGPKEDIMAAHQGTAT